MRDVSFFKSIVISKKAEKVLLTEIVEKNSTKLLSMKDRLDKLQKTGILLRTVGTETLKNLEFHISNLVTMALKAVNPKFPKLVMEFNIRRNQTECDIEFEDELGNRSNPIGSSGGGVLDVASFGLRTAFWAIRKNRPVMLLDEPFKFLSPGLHRKAGEMVKKISDKLGIQFIMVSHSTTINEVADKVFEIILDKEGVSHVN